MPWHWPAKPSQWLWTLIPARTALLWLLVGRPAIAAEPARRHQSADNLWSKRNHSSVGLDLSCLVQWELSVAAKADDVQRGRLWQESLRQPPAPVQQGQPTGPLHDQLPAQEQPQQAVLPQRHFGGEDSEPAVRRPPGMSSNAQGDLQVFIGALVSNAIVLVAAVIIFGFLRKWFPQMYANNVRSKHMGGLETAPFTPSDSFLGWIPAGLFITVDQAKAASGLDSALLLEYSSFGMKLLALIGVPLLLVLSPLQYWCGGRALLEVGDKLGTIGLNNVETGSWLFGFHAFVVWYVVFVIERMITTAMRKFVKLRFEWLESLEPPTSTTVLVEGLPEKLRSNSALAEYYSRIFPHEAVESANVVKHTMPLQAVITLLRAKNLALEKAVYKKTKLEKKQARDTAAKVKQLSDQIRQLEGEVKQLEGRARSERSKILRHASQVGVREESARDEEGGVFTPKGSVLDMALASAQALAGETSKVGGCSGFVTFVGKREAMLAMNARSTVDSEEMVLSIPPNPNDIIYDDLLLAPASQRIYAVLGYAAVFGIFCSYMPFVVGISTLTQLKNLEKIHLFHVLVKHLPALGTLVEGFFSTLGIVLFMSFLPTILMFIFKTFFCLKANGWGQLRLQIAYFWFLMTFVLLLTAVGASLLGRIMFLIKHPTEISGILADSLPTATHFYLNYLVMQWVVHAMNITRYIQITKFFFYRATLGEKRAVQLAEPEDQDYYGVGARSARWSLDLILGVVFCSITPLMTLVAFINFLIIRIVYGYLIVFAETRKHDIGGPFFVEQMKQLQYGELIYILLMIGVFARRAATWYPIAVAAVAVIPVAYGRKRLSDLAWETLPLDRITTDQSVQACREDMARYRALGEQRPRYVQPELSEKNWRSSQ